MLTSEDAVHGSFCCACYGVLLLIEGFLVQQALALGNADAGNCITHHVQGGDQHLDGACTVGSDRCNFILAGIWFCNGLRASALFTVRITS